MTRRISISMLSLGAAALALSGCGGSSASGSSSGSVNQSFAGTQAPGDFWTWNIQNGTFTATDITKSYTYTGTATTLQTGFLKLLIQTTTDPGVSAGDSAYAIELPNTALLIQPAGANTQAPITACALGSNPAGPTVKYNYVTVPSPTWTQSQSAAGDITFAVTGDTYAGTLNPFDINGNSLTQTNASFTCVNGRLTGSSNNNLNGAMTPSGVCVIDLGPNNGGVIGVQQPASNINLATMGTLSFKGFLIKQGKTQPIVATPNGDGTLAGVGYAPNGGVETGTLDSGGSGVTITFAQQLSPGLIQMQLATSGGGETIIAAVNQVGGKTMVLGFGAGTGSGNPPYNIMMIQQ